MREDRGLLTTADWFAAEVRKNGVTGATLQDLGSTLTLAECVEVIAGAVWGTRPRNMADEELIVVLQLEKVVAIATGLGVRKP